MKLRLLVMNGQRIIQSADDGGAWRNQKVDKAGGLKPGIYDLYNATAASKAEKYSGMIVHTDKERIYQQLGRNFVVHSRSDFDRTVDVGSNKTISYNEQGRGVAVADNSSKLVRGRSM